MSDTSWWLIGNAYHGMHVAFGEDGVAAKREVRARIAGGFMETGASASAAARAASSYRVFVLAGGLTREEADAGLRDWDHGDGDIIWQLHRRYRRRVHRGRRTRS